MARKKSRKKGKKIKGYIILILAVIAMAVSVIAIVSSKYMHHGSETGVPLYLGASLYGHVNIDTNTWHNIWSLLQPKLGFANASQQQSTVKASNIFTMLYNAEVNNGVSPDIAGSVPHMLVVEASGTLKAIVVGEVQDKEFWSNMLTNNTIVVVFGLTTCPHCQAMHEFFNKNFSSKAYFLWIDKD
uniref:Thioredoxin n=1 Tax=Ignisphaera aggregans TaxID=334771 RepID=A0A7J2U1H5_9CREN